LLHDFGGQVRTRKKTKGPAALRALSLLRFFSLPAFFVADYCGAYTEAAGKQDLVSPVTMECA